MARGLVRTDVGGPRRSGSLRLPWEGDAETFFPAGKLGPLRRERRARHCQHEGCRYERHHAHDVFSSDITDSVPELDRRFQRIAVDPGRIGETYLKIAFADGWNAVLSRLAHIWKGSADDAAGHIASQCTGDRITAAVGHEPDIR